MSTKNPCFQQCWSEFLACLRDNGRLPLDWSHSRAHPLDKGKGKEGCAGKRLIHIFCCIGSAWQSMSLKKGGAKQPNWAHGCVEGKSTEGAILVNLSAAWRLQQARRDHIMTYYDASNAFGSFVWPALLEGMNKLAGEEEADYHNEQLAQQAFDLTRHSDQEWGCLWERAVARRASCRPTTRN